jgi:hypothetical protein
MIDLTTTDLSPLTARASALLAALESYVSWGEAYRPSPPGVGFTIHDVPAGIDRWHTTCFAALEVERELSNLGMRPDMLRPDRPGSSITGDPGRNIQALYGWLCGMREGSEEEWGLKLVGVWDMSIQVDVGEMAVRLRRLREVVEPLKRGVGLPQSQREEGEGEGDKPLNEREQELLLAYLTLEATSKRRKVARLRAAMKADSEKPSSYNRANASLVKRGLLRVASKREGSGCWLTAEGIALAKEIRGTRQPV